MPVSRQGLKEGDCVRVYGQPGLVTEIDLCDPNFPYRVAYYGECGVMDEGWFTAEEVEPIKE